MKKYPEPVSPFNTAMEMYAWFYGQLSAMASIIAQYEKEEREREHARITEMLFEEEEKK